MKGVLMRYGNVWYHPTGRANVRSLYNVKKKYRVTYDRATDDCLEASKYDR